MKFRTFSVLLLAVSLSLPCVAGGSQAQLSAASSFPAASSFQFHHTSARQSLVQFTASSRYLLLPVEESREASPVTLIVDNHAVHSFNVKLAIDKVDYFVPLDLSAWQGKKVLLDVRHRPVAANAEAASPAVRWSDFQLSSTFDKSNRETYRPLYHQAPDYGWMNDPNGMFYKDGTYHLYYQYNPYGSQWENMNWGHATSTDLVHWKQHGVAIAPDALGAIFSGSAVVDHKNTAGFGAGAVVAFYTSAGERQTQSMAVSTDDGQTFTKYAGNPIITSSLPDFRDPKVIWHEPTQRWVMLLAAGQEMHIYTSANLKEWAFASRFGKEYGNHGGVWECPDLFELPVRGTKEKRWVLLCNINPGGPSGGSATQYFVGTFDGREFRCESAPTVTKWMDHGKDHYAAVTFDNAPQQRRIAIAWMSNWQYANQVPTKQFRSANSIACDLDLYRHAGEHYLARTPVPELSKLRGRATLQSSKVKESNFDANGGAYELVWTLPKSKKAVLTLSNDASESVVLTYDAAASTLSFDRTKSGNVAFSTDFPVTTVAPVHGKLRTLRILVDRSSVEVVDAEGRVSMTNLVFPSSPYHRFTQSAGSVTLYPLHP